MLSINLPVFVFHGLQKVLTWDNLQQNTQENKVTVSSLLFFEIVFGYVAFRMSVYNHFSGSLWFFDIFCYSFQSYMGLQVIMLIDLFFREEKNLLSR